MNACCCSPLQAGHDERVNNLRATIQKNVQHSSPTMTSRKSDTNGINETSCVVLGQLYPSALSSTFCIHLITLLTCQHQCDHSCLFCNKTTAQEPSHVAVFVPMSIWLGVRFILAFCLCPRIGTEICFKNNNLNNFYLGFDILEFVHNKFLFLQQSFWDNFGVSLLDRDHDFATH